MEEKQSLNGLTLQFDKWTSMYWSGNYEYNEMFLKATEYYLNDILLKKEYLSPEKIIDSLGMSWAADDLEKTAFLRYQKGYEFKIKILSPNAMEMYAPMTILISYEEREKT